MLLVGLILSLLVLGGESPRRVLLGIRPILGETVRGLALVPWVFLLAAVVVMAIARWAPWLVTPNPFETLASTRGEFVLFAIVAVVAGGVREEIQRAFILHRCEQRLGGALVGVIGFGIALRARPLRPGVERRDRHRRAWGRCGASSTWRAAASIAPMVSHASFNLIEVIAFGLLAGAGWACASWA